MLLGVEPRRKLGDTGDPIVFVQTVEESAYALCVKRSGLSKDPAAQPGRSELRNGGFETGAKLVVGCQRDPLALR